MNIRDIISKIPNDEDRFLFEQVRSSRSTSPEGEQARTLIQFRMIKLLIESLDKNSTSSDKLAERLNRLTLAIAIATGVGAIVAVLQLLK